MLVSSVRGKRILGYDYGENPYCETRGNYEQQYQLDSTTER
jgi:hypothetical protein